MGRNCDVCLQRLRFSTVAMVFASVIETYIFEWLTVCSVLGIRSIGLDICVQLSVAIVGSVQSHGCVYRLYFLEVHNPFDSVSCNRRTIIGREVVVVQSFFCDEWNDLGGLNSSFVMYSNLSCHPVHFEIAVFNRYRAILSQCLYTGVIV